MTMKIEVTIPEDEIRGDSAPAYLARAMSAIGFDRPRVVKWVRVAETDVRMASSVPAPTDDAADMNEVLPDEGPNYAAMKAAHDAALPPAASIAAREADATAEAPKRERGKPSPGRARRTKEEIAEDEAAEKAEASAPAPEPVALISTGEERIDPASPEDAAQDAADEAAEAEATKAPELTHEDVRDALKKYVAAYSFPFALEDGPKVLKMLFGPEAGKVSDIPGDQESLAKAIAGIEEMLTKNPFRREAQL